MASILFQGKLPLTGISINKLEDSESYKNGFEIVGKLWEANNLLDLA